MLSIVHGISIAVCFLVIRIILRKGRLNRLLATNKCQTPPRKAPYDFLGLIMPHQIVKNFQNSTVLPWTKSMFDTYNGTFITNIVGDDYLFTCHPQNVKHILADQFSDFSTSEERKHLFKHFSSRGILTLDGPAWVASREQLRRQFSHYRSIMDLDMYERHASQFIEQIPADGPTIDLQEMFGKLALDALTEFVMGTSVASLSGEQSEELQELSGAIKYIKSTIARKGFFGPMHWAVGRGEFKRQCDVVRNYVQKAALQTLKDRESKGDAFLEDESGYCFLRSLAVGEQNSDVLRDQVADIVLAGVDTLTSLLSATFWLLARDKRVLGLLRAKVRDACGSERPTYDQIKGLPYLRWVINEALRLFPPVSFDMRKAHKDTTLPSGGGPDGEEPIIVEKGQKVVFSSYSTHRWSAAYGFDAENFKPERWELFKVNDPSYLPFHMGPRSCPGQQYALMVSSYLVIRIIQSFPTIESRDDRPWKEFIEMTLSNANGVRVGLFREEQKS